MRRQAASVSCTERNGGVYIQKTKQVWKKKENTYLHTDVMQAIFLSPNYLFMILNTSNCFSPTFFSQCTTAEGAQKARLGFELGFLLFSFFGGLGPGISAAAATWERLVHL